MMSRARAVFLRIAMLMVLLVGGFVLLQEPAREAETRTSAWVLREAGFRIGQVRGSGVYVAPADRVPFYAVVTPSCSALASVLALAFLATVVPATSRRRKLGALGAAVLTVTLGNIIRISASLAVGLIFGRGSLVLFHDSVGNVFSFAYTLGGYILMLYILLPAKGTARKLSTPPASRTLASAPS